jgi:quercetin dioxygenase-like cupin family protein
MVRVQILLACLFTVSASADHHASANAGLCHMDYPNIEGEVLLENDAVVVQRFTLQPGQWEGIHRHPPSQLYIQLSDGDWAYKANGSIDNFSMAAGDASWNETSTELDAQHESRNVGDNGISYLWVGVKPGCLADPAAE